jgi:hypothetical protein
MNDEQDMLVIESELKKMGINLKEATDTEEGIEILKKELGLTDADFTKLSTKRYKILVPRAERYEYVKKIQDLEGFSYNPNTPGSSIGGISYKDSVFLLKPSGSQGRASAGTENEDILENEINKYLESGPKNIIFKGSNKDFTTRNIKEIKPTGYDVAGGKKADILLIGDKTYPISIKKDNAGFWESSDTRYKDVVTKLSQKITNGDFAPKLIFKPFVDKLGNTKEGINIMYDKETDSKVTGIIVTDLPSKEEESIIFGSDNAIVIYKTFSPSDFTLKENNLYITVSKILEDMDDIQEFNLEPVLNIRHDSTRTSTGGLRATVQPENKLYKDKELTGNKIELSYNEIMS